MYYSNGNLCNDIQTINSNTSNNGNATHVILYAIHSPQQYQQQVKPVIFVPPVHQHLHVGSHQHQHVGSNPRGCLNNSTLYNVHGSIGPQQTQSSSITFGTQSNQHQYSQNPNNHNHNHIIYNVQSLTPSSSTYQSSSKQLQSTHSMNRTFMEMYVYHIFAILPYQNTI